MSVDRRWMYERLDQNGFLNSEFEIGVETFLNFAYTQVQFICQDKIRCPCSKCQNRKFQSRQDVTYHLCKSGFVGGYTKWIAHGESITHEINSKQLEEQSTDYLATTNNVNDYRSMVIEAMDINYSTAGVGSSEMGNQTMEPNLEVSKFYELLHGADVPLWEGCNNHTKLSVFMGTVKSMLPEGNLLPDNFYNTKKMMSTLGLGHTKIDVCVNNCILYFQENIDRTSCTICGHPRYKPIQSFMGRRKKRPFKVPRNDDGGHVEPMGRLSIFTHAGRPFGHLDHGRMLSNEEYHAAHLYVLFNCPEIDPFIE
uniref:Transposase-associated domain-containing protein n=1 Tax=Manihot esculenta TaxID=3983 RepID=A0A2C9VG05_MANES